MYIDSVVLGFAASSARVFGVSFMSDGWFEFAGDDVSGENVNGSVGWMLINYFEYGILFEYVSGCELLLMMMCLVSVEAVIDVDYIAFSFRNEGYLYCVVYGLFVFV